jgi:hypothetical protein
MGTGLLRFKGSTESHSHPVGWLLVPPPHSAGHIAKIRKGSSSVTLCGRHLQGIVRKGPCTRAREVSGRSSSSLVPCSPSAACRARGGREGSRPASSGCAFVFRRLLNAKAQLSFPVPTRSRPAWARFALCGAASAQQQKRASGEAAIPRVRTGRPQRSPGPPPPSGMALGGDRALPKVPGGPEPKARPPE